MAQVKAKEVVVVDSYDLTLTKEEAQGLYELLYYGVAVSTLRSLGLSDLLNALKQAPGLTGDYYNFHEIARIRNV